MKIPAPLLSRIAAVVNAAIDDSDEIDQPMEVLEGRVLRVRPEPVTIDTLVRFTERSIEFIDDDGREVDIEIEGSPIQLLAMAKPGGSSGAHSEVRISGDLASAQALQALLPALAIDWEALLAQYLGDVPGHRLFRAGSGALNWLRAGANSLESDIAQYLRHELAIVPSREEVDAFLSDVDRARDELARLEARLARVQAAR